MSASLSLATNDVSRWRSAAFSAAYDRSMRSLPTLPVRPGPAGAEGRAGCMRLRAARAQADHLTGLLERE